MTSPHYDLILYDGVCGLCNRFVYFVIRRDSSDRFRFAALQSELGASLVRKHGGDPEALSTVYLIKNWEQEDERALVRGKAACTALAQLGGIWRVLGSLRVLPAPLLDLGYRVVAWSRYRVFGKYETCPMPTPEARAKFLETP